MYQTAIRYVLGIERCGDILNLSPNIPSGWSEAHCDYMYMETKYHIIITNTQNEKTLYLDGKKFDSFSVKMVNDKQTHIVKIES